MHGKAMRIADEHVAEYLALTSSFSGVETDALLVQLRAEASAGDGDRAELRDQVGGRAGAFFTPGTGRCIQSGGHAVSWR